MSNSTWQVEVDHATPVEWAQRLELFDDANIYQSAAYGGVRWGEKNLSRLMLKRDGQIVGMAQVRIIRPTPLKFGMAYLRWGPLWERRGQPLDSEVPHRLARAIEDEYLKRRKLFVRILPNAFVGSPRAEVFESAFSRFAGETSEPVETYRTFLMDLSLPLEELRSGLDKKWRNQLSRSERNNLTVISGNGSDEYRAFREIYTQMLGRKAFDTTVDAEEFGRMQETLMGSQRMRVLICKDNDVAVAGLVATAIGDTAIYLLGATSDAGLNAKGAYLLQWTLICWLKEQGIKFYDLGGIDPEANPGVYHFKKGLSGVDICMIKSRAASESAVSTALVKGSLAVRRTLRASLKPRNLVRSPKQSAVVS